MRIKKSQNRLKQKPLFIALAAVILLVLVGVVFAYHYQIGPFHKEGLTTQEILEKQNKSDSTNPQTKAQSAETSEDVDVSKNTSEVPVSEALQVKISKLVQENHGITYQAAISGSSKDGTCSATFTSSLDRPIVRSHASQNGTCGPVTIPETEFSALGKWTLTLRFYSDDVQAVDTKTIEVK